ncbi:hypothetical protein BGZ94_004584 [Podila epigama]|nr:hypothetical protein BGZ94_004584 [Podila epigama]
MVSISPSYGESGSGDKKFLSMSKPIFATVVGLVSAVICGVILFYVVRPLVRKRRRQDDGGGGSGGSTVETPTTPSEYRKEQGPRGSDNVSGPMIYNNNNYSNSTYINDNNYNSNNNNNNSNYMNNDGNLAMETSEKQYYAYQQPPPPQQQQQLQKQPLPQASIHSFENLNNINTEQYFEQPSNGYNNEYGKELDTDMDDEAYTKSHLESLRQQESSMAAQPIPDTTLSHSQYVDDVSGSGLPAWRQEATNVPLETPPLQRVPTTEAQEIIASYNARQAQQYNDSASATEHSIAPPQETTFVHQENEHEGENEQTQEHHEVTSSTQSDVQEDNVSIASVRNGSGLFEGPERRPNNPRPVTAINTNLAREGGGGGGGLASALRRQRMSNDATTPLSSIYQSAYSPHATVNSAHSTATPRASFSDDFATARTSLDSHRRDIQLRFNDLTSTSSAVRQHGSTNSFTAAAATASGTNATPRASFSDDYPPASASAGRKSIESYRAMPPLTSVAPFTSSNENLGGSEPKNAYEAYINSRRDSNSAM